MSRIRVLVADDQIFAVEGLRQIVAGADDMEVVGQANTITEVLELTEKTQPDVIVLDIAWPGDQEAGIRAVPHIRARSPHTQIVTVTVYTHLIGPARNAGTFPLDKSFSKAELLSTIRWAHQSRGTPLSNAAAYEAATLTDRELQVLNEVAKGLADKQIAFTLQMAEGTVKKHVANILGKLGAANRTEAAVIAERMGLTRRA